MSRCSFLDLAVLGLAVSLLAMPPLVLAGTLAGQPAEATNISSARTINSPPAPAARAATNLSGAS